MSKLFGMHHVVFTSSNHVQCTHRLFYQHKNKLQKNYLLISTIQQMKYQPYGFAFFEHNEHVISSSVVSFPSYFHFFLLLIASMLCFFIVTPRRLACCIIVVILAGNFVTFGSYVIVFFLSFLQQRSTVAVTVKKCKKNSMAEQKKCT